VRAWGDTLDVQAVRQRYLPARPGRMLARKSDHRGPPMTTCVALLRSVNLAGHRRIKMDELRQVFRTLGYTDVTTYIQSGNVVFTSDAQRLPC
jgi:Protein of unknown function (DUF1697)